MVAVAAAAAMVEAMEGMGGGRGGGGCGGGGGGGSKRWLNTGRHLLTVALSSSHWFPVKCIAETRRSAPKRHKHELIFEGIEGDPVRDTIDARTCRDACSRTCVVSVVSLCASSRIVSTYQRAFRMTETTMT